MPEISNFYGIVITMYFPEHNPPHFHVRYNEYHASIDIQTGKVTGEMPRRALKLVYDWLDLHKDELMETGVNWKKALRLQKFNLWINMETATELKWVTSARNLSGYRLALTFNDGSERVFDCEPLIEQYPIFASLRDKAVFDHFDLDGWTITWLDGSIDIAPEYLYENSVAA